MIIFVGFVFFFPHNWQIQPINKKRNLASSQTPATLPTSRAASRPPTGAAAEPHRHMAARRSSRQCGTKRGREPGSTRAVFHFVPFLSSSWRDARGSSLTQGPAPGKELPKDRLLPVIRTYFEWVFYLTVVGYCN